MAHLSAVAAGTKGLLLRPSQRVRPCRGDVLPMATRFAARSPHARQTIGCASHRWCTFDSGAPRGGAAFHWWGWVRLPAVHGIHRRGTRRGQYLATRLRAIVQREWRCVGSPSMSVMRAAATRAGIRSYHPITEATGVTRMGRHPLVGRRVHRARPRRCDTTSGMSTSTESASRCQRHRGAPSRTPRPSRTTRSAGHSPDR